MMVRPPPITMRRHQVSEAVRLCLGAPDLSGRSTSIPNGSSTPTELPTRSPTTPLHAGIMSIWRSRGYLPHFDAPGLLQSITFRLADSLPGDVAERLQRTCAEDDIAKRRRIEAYLDRGFGDCTLRDPDCAITVENALMCDDGQDYRLLAWAIMPNHVHVLIATMPGHPIGVVVKNWKGRTARTINQRKGRSGTLWQREYWDRFIRDEAHYLRTMAYIEANPVQAGLVVKTEDWRWSSAWWRTASSNEPMTTDGGPAG